ncbi:MAG: hypothetical protein NVSMB28_20100 [Collimonas sp.]
MDIAATTEATMTVMRRKAGNWDAARPGCDWDCLGSAEEDRVMK